MALTTAITIVGNATYDPELRQTRDSKPVVNLTVAVNPRTYNRDTNQWEDGEPVFYKASAFGNLAEHIAGSVTKGTRVLVHGNMKANKWTDKESGVQRSENVILIEEIGLSLQFTNAQTMQGAPRGGGGQAPDNGNSGNAGGGWDDTPW